MAIYKNVYVKRGNIKFTERVVLIPDFKVYCPLTDEYVDGELDNGVITADSDRDIDDFVLLTDYEDIVNERNDFEDEYIEVRDERDDLLDELNERGKEIDDLSEEVNRLKRELEEYAK